MEEPDFIIVDGSNALWRGGAAMSGLSVEIGGETVYTGGVKGLLDIVTGILGRLDSEPDVFVAWEGGGSKRRRKVVDTYKVREPNPRRDELWERIKPQYGLIEGILSQSSWTQLVAPGWEADDAMGTLAAAASRAGLNSWIVTSDADLLQCIADPEQDGWVHIWQPGTAGETLWDTEHLMQVHGVRPDQIPDVKALAGDSSDGYSGAKGIGMKYACKFVAEYGDLEGVIEAARHGDLTASKTTAVLENPEYLYDCLKVARIAMRAETVRTSGACDPQALEEKMRALRLVSYVTNKNKMRMLL